MISTATQNSRTRTWPMLHQYETQQCKNEHNHAPPRCPALEHKPPPITPQIISICNPQSATHDLQPVIYMREHKCAHRLQPSFKAAELLESVGLLWRLGLRFAGTYVSADCMLTLDSYACRYVSAGCMLTGTFAFTLVQVTCWLLRLHVYSRSWLLVNCRTYM